MKLDYAAIATTLALSCIACTGDDEGSSTIRLVGRVEAQQGATADAAGTARVSVHLRSESGLLEPIEGASSEVDAKGEYALSIELERGAEIVVIAADEAGEIGRAAASVTTATGEAQYLPPINGQSTIGASLLLQADAQVDTNLRAAWMELVLSAETRLAVDAQSEIEMGELAQLLGIQGTIWSGVTSSPSLAHQLSDYLAALDALVLEVSSYHEALHEGGDGTRDGLVDSASQAFASGSISAFEMSLAARASLEASIKAHAENATTASETQVYESAALLDRFARDTVLQAKLWSEDQREELVQLAAEVQSRASARIEAELQSARVAFSTAVATHLSSGLAIGDALVSQAQQAVRESHARAADAVQDLPEATSATVRAETVGTLWLYEWEQLSTESEISALLTAQLGEEEAQLTLQLLFAATAE